MFHVYATRLDANVWTMPVRLSDRSGRNTRRPAVATHPDGFLQLAYSSDPRSPENLPSDQMHALHYDVFTASLAAVESGAPELAEVAVATPDAGFEQRQRVTMASAGKAHTLLLGDCHRHTHMRGHSAVDGAIEDTYRYAIDAARMDFVGPSDHNEVLGGRWPDSLRDYRWWHAQKMVDVCAPAPKFWGIHTHEHSMPSPGGHRSALHLKRGAPLRPTDRAKGRSAPDNIPPALWQWMQENPLK